MPSECIPGLQGKVALVTGASRGIGAASARSLANQGVDLILVGRSHSNALKDIAAELGRDVDIAVLACDSANPEEIAGLYREVRSEYGRLDILVNNAGILEDALIGMISPDMVDRVLAVNTVGPLLHVQAAARLMRKSGGSIINLSSIIGRVGNSGQMVYAASKAAVIGMTLAASKELAPRSIRVNAVAPGFIETDMTRSLPKDKYRERVDSIAMGRVGTPEDVAGVVSFLASDLAAYVTGQIVGVDGGMLV